MHLSDHSLGQLDDAYLDGLEEGALRGLSRRLLEDLKEARERLRQNPTNSSRPPSSRAPWERPGSDDAAAEAVPSATATPDPVAETPDSASAVCPSAIPRRAGKQPGAPGVGRTPVLRAQETRHHRPASCAGCGRTLPEETPCVAYAGFQSLDLTWGDPATPGCGCR